MLCNAMVCVLLCVCVVQQQNAQNYKSQQTCIYIKTYKNICVHTYMIILNMWTGETPTTQKSQSRH
jgi:hypothetical protein